MTTNTRPLRGLDGYSATRHAADSGPYDRGILRIVLVCLHVCMTVRLCVYVFVCSSVNINLCTLELARATSYVNSRTMELPRATLYVNLRTINLPKASSCVNLRTMELPRSTLYLNLHIMYVCMHEVTTKCSDVDCPKLSLCI